jgi:gliding motility-associated-like protein
LLTLDFLKLNNVKCNGDTNAQVLPLPSGGEAPYTGTWVGYPYPDTLFYGRAGIYTYTVTDIRGCTISKNDTFVDPIKLDISANILTQIFCAEDSTGIVELFGTGGTGALNYVWNIAPIASNIVSKVTEGVYLAYVYDQNFCYDSVAVTMTASNPEKCGLIVPSGFTPNGDGKNDNFFIRGLGDYSENELTIFNRWGETVYKATNYQNDWNGKPNKSTLMSGNEGIVPNDTYYFVLYTKANNKTLNGYVYITK